MGDGTTTRRTVPVQVQGLIGAMGVSMRSSHALAMRSDGAVWAWGSNSSGQLGNGGPTLYTTTPTLSLLY